MHDLNAPGRLFFQLERREGGIVSPDGHQARDAQPHQGGQDLGKRLGLLRWIRSRGAQIRPASEVNATHLFDQEGPDLAYTAFHEPFESVEDTNHVATAEHTSDRDRTNYTIDARGWSAPD